MLEEKKNRFSRLVEYGDGIFAWGSFIAAVLWGMVWILGQILPYASAADFDAYKVSQEKQRLEDKAVHDRERGEDVQRSNALQNTVDKILISLHNN